MKYKTATISESGKVRSHNEDSLLVRRKKIGKEELLLAAVADGVGGLSYGDKASQMVVDKLNLWWDSFVCKLQGRPDLQMVGDMLKFVLENIHVNVCEEMERLQAKMGSTVSLIFICGNEYLICQVGDSRIYLVDKKKVLRLTVDQTWCQRELDAGNLTEAEVVGHEKSHVLTNAIGIKTPFYSVLQRGCLRKGQRVVLCTDGYYSEVSIYELCPKRFRRDLQKELDQTANIIHQGEAADNYTAVLIEVC